MELLGPQEPSLKIRPVACALDATDAGHADVGGTAARAVLPPYR